MNIFCFDTALDKTYIALLANDKVENCEIKSDENNYHSAYLLPKTKEIFAKLNLSYDKLDFLATNCGPGSFTGIRAALSVAKVMSLELDLPVVNLNSCEILKRASKKDAVLLDARRSMYYFYENGEISLILKDEVLDKIKNKTVVGDLNSKKEFGSKNDDFVAYEEQNYPLGQVMLDLAQEKISASKNPKEEFSSAKLKANYIQTPPVFSNN